MFFTIPYYTVQRLAIPARGGFGEKKTIGVAPANIIQHCQKAIFLCLSHTARILSLHTVARMASSHLPPELLPCVVDRLPLPGMGFGLGFGVEMDGALGVGPLTNKIFYWGGAASTSFFIDPREQLTAVLITPGPQQPHPVW
ncbi:MAG: hypothetical protein IH586_05310 [Anaerolineaceae bacterium]|nr:hypothetical protein [Anaerolineaceae bacterium]